MSCEGENKSRFIAIMGIMNLRLCGVVLRDEIGVVALDEVDELGDAVVSVDAGVAVGETVWPPKEVEEPDDDSVAGGVAVGAPLTPPGEVEPAPAEVDEPGDADDDSVAVGVTVGDPLTPPGEVEPAPAEVDEPGDADDDSVAGGVAVGDPLTPPGEVEPAPVDGPVVVVPVGPTVVV
uniref:Candidate secreted effector n=1 Tax=Meloidogyne incognita TaxID=6306 RepID=A0A914N615_MELIC